jgi:predicted PhzF superfamily epimerase YddE/YHI9
MTSYPYTVVDVNTAESLEGIALPIFPNAFGMDEKIMQRIARELNLAETCFALLAAPDSGSGNGQDRRRTLHETTFA